MAELVGWERLDELGVAENETERNRFPEFPLFPRKNGEVGKDFRKSGLEKEGLL